MMSMGVGKDQKAAPAAPAAGPAPAAAPAAAANTGGVSPLAAAAVSGSAALAAAQQQQPAAGGGAMGAAMGGAGARAKKGDDDDDDDDEIEQLQYKIAILGDGAVGKTSIAFRFCEDYFAKTYKQTIGVNWYLKRVVLPGQNPADVHVALQLWDIGGQQIGSKMIGKYIYGAHAILLCYDITNYQSFQNVEDWLKLVKQTFDKEPLPYIALVGNKMDLLHLRTVKDDKHNQFANENNLYRYLVSAKQADGVHPTFMRIAADLAGIVLTKSELEATAKVVTAEIVNHPQHDPAQAPLQLKQEKSICTLM